MLTVPLGHLNTAGFQKQGNDISQRDLDAQTYHNTTDISALKPTNSTVQGSYHGVIQALRDQFVQVNRTA